MKTRVITIGLLIVSTTFCLCAESVKKESVKPVVRKIVQSLINSDDKIPVPIADTVFAIDNGETVSKKDFKAVWHELCKSAFKEKVSVDKFFSNIKFVEMPVTENKKVMSTKKLLRVYAPQKGDVYCNVSKVKEGTKDFIGYDKAFIYIFRKVKGEWILIGIGG